MLAIFASYLINFIKERNEKEKKIFGHPDGCGSSGLVSLCGVSTYDAYAGVDESDLLLANIETLADVDEAWNPVCYNGGPGSTSCSIGAGISIGQGGVSGDRSVPLHDRYNERCRIRCKRKKE